MLSLLIKKELLKLPLCLLSLLIFAYISFAQPYTLELNLKPGDSYIHNTNFKVLTVQNLPDMTLDYVSDISSILKYHVKKLENNKYELVVSYEKMDFETKGLHQSQLMGSLNSKKDSALYSTIKTVLNNSYLVTMSKNGEIIEIDKIDSTKGGNAGNTISTQFPELGVDINKMENYIGQKYIVQGTEMMTDIFPTKPVYVGDTWSKTFQLNMEAPIISNVTFKLKEANSRFYIIQGKGILKSTPQNINTKFGDYEYQFNFLGYYITNLKIDAKTGWLIESTIKQEFNGSVSILGDYQLYHGNKFQMSVTSEAKITDH